MRPKVSLTLIVKDEAPVLGRCLESVAGLVDEMVVVDTGSTDSSRELAASHGARVSEFAWTDSFADARNESLRLARGEWALWLDADEWLDPTARDRLRALIARLDANPEPTVYFLNQESNLAPDAGLGGMTVAQPRLFRNDPDIRWCFRVHEQILGACLATGTRLEFTDIVIRHSGYESEEVRRVKGERNLRLLERDLLDHPDNPFLLFQFGRDAIATDFPGAERMLRAALAGAPAHDPIRPLIAAVLARGYRSHGRVRQARAALDDALRSRPNDSKLLIESGNLAIDEGDPDRAIAAFQTLLSTPPDPEERCSAYDPAWRGWKIRHSLAVVLLRLGRSAEAEIQLRAALAEEPAAVHLHLGLAEIQLESGRWTDLDESIDVLAVGSASNPWIGRDDAPTLRARAHLARLEFADARAVLRPLIERSPTEVHHRLLLSRTYLQEGADIDSAEEALRDVLDLDPNHPEAGPNLAALLAHLEREDAVLGSV